MWLGEHSIAPGRYIGAEHRSAYRGSQHHWFTVANELRDGFTMPRPITVHPGGVNEGFFFAAGAKIVRTLGDWNGGGFERNANARKPCSYRHVFCAPEVKRMV